MNFYERLHAVLHRQQPDQVPFAPYDNLVPRGEFERELAERGMGVLHRLSGRIWSEMPHVEIETKTDGDLVRTTYHTPKGSVWTENRTHLGRVTGVTGIQTEGLIKEIADIKAVIFMIDDTVYSVDNSAFSAKQRELGGYGLVRDQGLHPPYDSTRGYFGHYAGIPAWIYAQQDQPALFKALIEAEERRQDRLYPLIVSSPADYIAFGSLDGHFGPRNWATNVLPFLQRFVPQLQAAGKIVSLHAHASNNLAYADLLRETGVDVVEAFTPPPVGDLSIAEARRRWGPDVVIWVNFPETVFYYGYEETRRYTMDLIKSDPPGDRLVIGFTEMGTYGITDAESERIFKAGFRAVVEAIEACGAYPVRA